MHFRYRLNPTALAFWAFLGLAGYLVSGTVHGALVGLVIGLGISVLIDLVFSK